MKNSQKILIGKKIWTREELFKEEEKSRKKYAEMPFEKKIEALVELQKFACSWGRKKNVSIWER